MNYTFVIFIVFAFNVQGKSNVKRPTRIPDATSLKHGYTSNPISNTYPNLSLANISNSRCSSKHLYNSINSFSKGALLTNRKLTTSISNYYNSLKILFANPLFPLPSSSELKMTFLRGLIVPIFISTILLTNFSYKYLEDNWAFQGYWNGLSTKDLTTIALTIHLLHSLYKLFVLRTFFIANLTDVKCSIIDYFYPTSKSMISKIIEWNPKLVTNILGLISVAMTAASLYVGIILAETGWSTANPILKGGETFASAIAIVSLIKSLFLKQDFSSLVNVNHYITPIDYRSKVKNSYVLSKLFKTTVELPEEYKSVMLSQSEMKLISFLATVVPFTSFILKLFPTCLETFSMLLLLSINLNTLSMAGLFTSLIHAIVLLIENIIHNYDRQLLIKDIDAMYRA